MLGCVLVKSSEHAYSIGTFVTSEINSNYNFQRIIVNELLSPLTFLSVF